MSASGHRKVNPAELGPPRGYSNGVLAAAGSRMLYIAGQVGWDREQCLVSNDFAGQFERALDNVLAVVREAGGVPEDLVRVTLYVTDKALYEESLQAIGAAWRRRLDRHYPAMTLVEVGALLEEGALVELEATAALPPGEE
ncbi:MAG: RidA family protein [Thermoanaerobaculia bacterium]|nr:MAG: RidA family protein [Thermoanaerobaculia bacterium]